MTTNTTVDILKYTASPTAKTSGPKASATMSYADKSNNFTNILDTANKTYSTQKTSSNDSNNTHHMSGTATSTSKNHTENTNAVNKSQNENNKTNDSEHTKTEVVSKQEPKTNETTTAESNQVQEKVENTTTTDEKTTTTEEETATTNAKTNAEKIANAKAEAQIVSDEANTEKATEDKDALKATPDCKAVLDNTTAQEAKALTEANTAALATEEIATVPSGNSETKPNDTKKADNKDKEDSTSPVQNEDKAIPVAALAELGIATALENVVVSQPQAVSTETVDSMIDPNTNNIKSVQALEVKMPEDNTKIDKNDLNELTQTNFKNIAPKENNGNVQQNVQQNAQQNIQQEPAELKVAQQNTATQTEELKAQDANVETPVIKVNTEAIASDINLNSRIDDKNTNTKNNLDKASITQEIIDKTNAKITSVQNTDSSNTDANDLLKKQHAGEQAIRFALENNSNNKENTQNVAQPIAPVAQNIDLTSITVNPATQSTQTQPTNFAKTLENVQMPMETPQELDKTDVLSQINNKLDGFKDEGTNKITIILRPENLGKINLEFVNSKEGLTAKITADSAQVKELLDKNLDSLKDTLGNQGVNINNVSVKVAESAKQDSTNYFEQQSQQNQQQSNGKQMDGQMDGNGFSFDEETNNFTNTAETNQETEDIASIDNNPQINTGKVDYKV